MRALLARSALLVLWVATLAQAAPRRFAVVVGSDQGERTEVTLRYATDDAQRLAKILTGIGGFRPEDVQVLTDVDARDVERSLNELNTRIRGEPEALLLVFFSGHGDADSLHLRGTKLQVATLRRLVTESPAGARILIVDACRSGALTLLKGGRPAPAFQIDFDQALSAEGTAILTSSAAGEDSQESETLGGSFFTHFLASGLIGAGDADGDGKVTLEESFAYASERTVAATSATVAGPQHPTFRFDLGGQRGLVLTQPGMASRRFGALQFSEPGAYLVHQGQRDGRVVAEVDSAKGARRIVLPPGEYFVVRRFADYLLEGKFWAREGQTTDVQPQAMRRVAYAQVVRKGGTTRQSAWSLTAMAGVRSAQLALGPQVRGEAGLRLDLPALSLELHAGVARSHHQNASVDLTTTQTFALLSVLKAFDLGPATVAVGLEAGAGLLHQGYADTRNPSRTAAEVILGPVANAQLLLTRQVFARVEAALETDVLKEGAPGVADWTSPLAVRAGAGVGFFF